MVSKRKVAKQPCAGASVGFTGMLEHDLSKRVAEIIAQGRDQRIGLERGDILRQHLLSKFADPSPAQEQARHDSAIAKLLRQESVNRETNLRLASSFDVHVSGVTFQSIFWTAKSEICRILGDLDSHEWLGYCSFSSGASSTRKRKFAQQPTKFDNRSSASWRVWEILLGEQQLVDFPNSEISDGFLYEYGVDGHNDLICHNYNDIFTVPKNDEINRCAAKEPDWNMFLQKGLGCIIRDRLTKVGIDLNDQSVNRRLAREGSITGKLATVDLSAASDSITCKLVQLLLPTDWYDALSSVRSEFGRIDGDDHRWELFSTMGNGFTFELESLIFYALVLATKYHFGIKGTVSIYGDDIICPVETVEPLISVFSFCGFVVNSEKSFFTGDYRESCGGHYVRGIDVTPIYIRGPIDDLPSLINIINQFRRWACIDGYGDEHNFTLWKKLCQLVPKDVRPIIMGGNDVFQSSYIACKRRFRGGVFRVSQKVHFRGLDAIAAYRSWLWNETIVCLLDEPFGLSPQKTYYRMRGNAMYASYFNANNQVVFTDFSTYDSKSVVPIKDTMRFCLKASWNCETDLDLKPKVIRNDGWEYRHSADNCGEFLFYEELFS